MHGRQQRKEQESKIFLFLFFQFSNTLSSSSFFEILQKLSNHHKFTHLTCLYQLPIPTINLKCEKTQLVTILYLNLT